MTKKQQYEGRCEVAWKHHKGARRNALIISVFTMSIVLLLIVVGIIVNSFLGRPIEGLVGFAGGFTTALSLIINKYFDVRKDETHDDAIETKG